MTTQDKPVVLVANRGEIAMRIIAAARSQIVQHLEGGIVSEILVREGQAVKAGEVLMRLSDVQANTSVQQGQSKLWSLKAQHARLSAEAEGLEKLTFAEDIPPEFQQLEMNAFRERATRMQSEKLVLRQQVSQRQSELNEAKARTNGLATELDLARKQSGLMEGLYKKGAASQMEMLEAQGRADPVQAELCAKALENRIKLEAKSIADKYLEPPHTTDFAVMFLPTEGLYAEVLRRPGLMETLQRDHRVTLAGPTNLMAMLNALQMGFRTLALEKRSSEVWQVLGAVKTEFGKFGDVLDKVRNQTQTVLNTLDQAQTRSNVMNRALRQVDALPESDAQALLPGGDA